MKLHYYPETDSLYIDLSSKTSANSKEVAKGSFLILTITAISLVSTLIRRRKNSI